MLHVFVACPCFVSMLHVACPFMCMLHVLGSSCCSSLLHVRVAYPCFTCPYRYFLLHVHSCPFYMTALLFRTCQCCMSLLHVHVECPYFISIRYCMSILYVLAARLCCMPILHIIAACPCSMYTLLVHAACTC